MFDFTICQIGVFMFNTYIFTSVIINIEYVLCRKYQYNYFNLEVRVCRIFYIKKYRCDKMLYVDCYLCE